MSLITVIGKNSFLAKALAKNTNTQDWTFLDHQTALSETDWVKKSDVVINCAFHPDLRQNPYNPIQDIDFLLAGYVKRSNAHYIMLSSRAVYGEAPEDTILREDMTAKPTNAYGINKLKSEQAVASVLPPERFTIIRSSNIFGNEYGRSTFFGLMLTSLKDKNALRFNIAADAVRDFLSARQWAEYMIKIANSPKDGFYNLGAGWGITTQDLAEMMIEYHSSGEIVYTDDSYEGQFILDMNKTKNAFGLEAYTKDNFQDDVKRALAD